MRIPRLALLHSSSKIARAGVVAAVVISGLTLEAPGATSRGRVQSLERGEMLAERGSRSVNRAYALAIQRDGKLVAAGGSDVARYTARGKLDPSFGRGGKVVTKLTLAASGLAIQRGGKLIAAGSSGYPERFGLVRYTARGKLDSSFGRGGKVVTDFGPPKRIRAFGRAVAIQADGKAVVVGGSGKPLGPTRFALTRYTARGALDVTFGQRGKVVTDAPDGVAWAVAIQRDGRIVAAGRGALVRYTADGKLDPSFGSGGMVLTDLGSESRAFAVAIQADGKLVVAGQAYLSAGSDFALARYTADGSLDPSFGSGGKVVTNFGFRPVNCPDCEPSDEWASAVAVQQDGKIVAAGGSDVRGAVGQRSGTPFYDFALARYNADGSLDPSFGDGGKVLTQFESEGSTFAPKGSASAEDVGLQADGRIVAAGGAAGYFALARYSASGKLDPSFGSSGEVLTTFGSG